MHISYILDRDVYPTTGTCTVSAPPHAIYLCSTFYRYNLQDMVHVRGTGTCTAYSTSSYCTCTGYRGYREECSVRMVPVQDYVQCHGCTLSALNTPDICEGQFNAVLFSGADCTKVGKETIPALEFLDENRHRA